MKPKVSVIIPVYNTQEYLPQCLDSLIGQTLKDFELICVDDGSQDESLDVLKRYAERDSRIKVIAQENGGVSHARNVGMSHATGKYLMFVDSDDYIERKALERVWNAAQADDADIVVFGGMSFPTVEWIDQKLKVRRTKYQNRWSEALMHENGSRPFMCNKAYRRAMLQEHGVEFYEKLRMGEDQAFQFVVFPLARQIVYIKDRLYHYRQEREASAMNLFAQDKSRKLKAHVEMLEYVYERWSREGLMESHGTEFLNWAIDYLCADMSAELYDASLAVAEAVSRWMAGRDVSTLEKEVQKQVEQLQHMAETSRKETMVSVIVPVYNAQLYLDQCVQSLQAQSMKNFEMIFVDDGSSDESVEILQRYQETDRRITLLRQEHEFAGAARNRAMQHAQGKYLLFLDADDFFEPELLEKSVAQIEAYQADVCVFRADAYDQKKKMFAPMPWTCRVGMVPQDQVFNRETEPRNIFCFTTAAPWTKLYSRKFVQQYALQYQCVRSANDLKFTFTALALAEKIIVLDECLVHYRVNTGTSLQQTQDKDPMTFYQALKALREELKEHGVYQQLEPAYKNFALDCCLYNLNTLKSCKNFEYLYYQLKTDIFDELGLNDHDETYYYAYQVNQIYQKREDINGLGVLEYVEKYGLLFNRERAEEVVRLREQLQEILSSKSYHIGRIVTALPRALRGGIRCFRENGIGYTVKHFGKKLTGRT